MSSSITSTSSGSQLSSILASGSLQNFGNSSATTNSTSSLAVTGLASGMDWSTVVSELAQAERTPEAQWEQQQSNLNSQNSVYTTLKTQLTALQTDIQALQDSSLYSSAASQSSNSAVATASTASGATLGNYTFNISQLATAAQWTGAGNISQAISPTNDPSSVTIGTAGFSTPVTAGTFTVDGKQVSVATTDSLQDVFDAIATATGNNVTASYSSTTDKISLSSADGSPIVLGSAADTSNFLQVAKLYNNGTSSVSSNATLGTVQPGATMTDADLKTAVTDGGSGQGAFTINGVTINYNASSDSIQNVLSRINGSAAGVNASYDPVNDRFVLTDTTTGDVGISMQDVTGNFLAATGLSSGALQSGQNLIYTLNGGTQQLVSQSNTISSSSSNIAGLSVTALQTGSTSVNVSTDTSKITSAIQQFVTDYNAAQTTITSNQLVSTSASGTVSPGILTGDQTANDLAGSLRSLVTSVVPGLSGGVSMLSDLGIQTNGQDNTLSVDSDTLSSAVLNNLTSVQTMFTDPTNGLATQVNNFLNNAIGANGTVTNHQASLAQQNTDLGTQISNLEAKISSDSATWTSEFQAMEQAESTTNQELTYLSEQVSSGAL